MTDTSGRCVLRTWHLLIALGPIVVFVFSDQLLKRLGLPAEWMPPHFAEFDGNKEGAARLNTLGTFFLFMASAAGALAFFLYTLRLLDRTWRSAVLAAFLILSGGTGLIVQTMNTPESQEYLGSALVCAALAHNPQTSNVDIDGAVPQGQQPRVKARDQRINGKCMARSFNQLRDLLRWEKIGIVLGVASVVFGSICCLAGPRNSSAMAAEQKLSHYEEQSERLNTYLYLSALLLVTGLLFAAAFLRWPSHALMDTARYDTHANALISYYGFSYSVLIASYYAPVATILSARVKALKPAASATAKLPEAFRGPLQVLKIAAAIFSTTLASLLSNLVSVSG